MENLNNLRKTFYFYQQKIESLISSKKILLAILLSIVVSYNPGAIEKSEGLPDKIVPGNIRLTNSNSSGAEFAGCDNTIRFFFA